MPYRLTQKVACWYSLLTLIFFLTSLHPDPTVESHPSSELLRVPSQSPTPPEPASPVRLFRLPVEDEDNEALLSGIANQHHGDDSDTFFNSATERQHRENLLQALHDGKQLPRNLNRPDYTFNVPLGGKDWGPQMTEIYDATRKKTHLTFEDLNEIAYIFLPCKKFTCCLYIGMLPGSNSFFFIS